MESKDSLDTMFKEPCYLLSRDQQDLVLCFLQAFFGTRDFDLVAGVVRSWDLDFGGSLEF